VPCAHARVGLLRSLRFAGDSRVRAQARARDFLP